MNLKYNTMDTLFAIKEDSNKLWQGNSNHIKKTPYYNK